MPEPEVILERDEQGLPLIKFTPTEAAIAQWDEEEKALDCSTPEGYEQTKAFIKQLVSGRNTIDKARLRYGEEAREYLKRVNAQGNGYIERIKAIEARAKAKAKVVDDAKEAEARALIEAEDKKRREEEDRKKEEERQELERQRAAIKAEQDKLDAQRKEMEAKLAEQSEHTKLIGWPIGFELLSIPDMRAKRNDLLVYVVQFPVHEELKEKQLVAMQGMIAKAQEIEQQREAERERQRIAQEEENERARKDQERTEAINRELRALTAGMAGAALADSDTLRKTLTQLREFNTVFQEVAEVRDDRVRELQLLLDAALTREAEQAAARAQSEKLAQLQAEKDYGDWLTTISETAPDNMDDINIAIHDLNASKPAPTKELAQRYERVMSAMLARRETLERKFAEEQAALIAAEQAAEEARRQAMAPDLEKLRQYGAQLRDVPEPELATDEAKETLANFTTQLHAMIDTDLLNEIPF